ncbi:MAG TPA: hypothetical protein VEA69_14805 [Tepidisphaeraceae bacterium]|nr:hypothetical protein [Tepidisphaeraceae bacterium]
MPKNDSRRSKPSSRKRPDRAGPSAVTRGPRRNQRDDSGHARPAVSTPADLVRAAIDAGEEDARWVWAFLGAVGLGGTEGSAKLVSRSPAFLLGLAYALRVCRWEAAGLAFPPAAALPAGRRAVTDVLGAAAAAAGPARALDALVELTGRLATTVNRASVRHLAWCGPRVLKADFLLGAAPADLAAGGDDDNQGQPAIDEQLADALAVFLWAACNKQENTDEQPEA